jgi:hypothetical protein
MSHFFRNSLWTLFSSPQPTDNKQSSLSTGEGDAVNRHHSSSQSLNLPDSQPERLQEEYDDDVLSAFGGSTDDNNSNNEQQQRQQQQQHQANINVNSVEKPSSSSSSSPLDEFFAHAASSSNSNNPSTGVESGMTPKQWRGTRRQFLAMYFTRRLFGADDDDDENEDRENEDRENEECSFCSDVLDEAFVEVTPPPPASNATAANDNDTHSENEQEDDDEGYPMLGTQPDSAFPLQTPNFRLYDGEDDGREGMSGADEGGDENEAARAPDTNELVNGATLGNNRDKRGLLSGIKRKLGFMSRPNVEEGDSDDVGDDEEGLLETQPMMTHTHPVVTTLASKEGRQQPATTAENRRTNNKKQGLMWNGDFDKIPCVEDLNTPCSKLNEVDLNTRTLDLGLCRVLRVWDLRLTKRMDKMSRRVDDLGTDDTVMDGEGGGGGVRCMTCPYESFEDDGPLNTIYKKVFSVEIAQLDDVKEDDNNNPSNGSPFVSNIATAAFPTGEQQLRKEAVRKRRHNVRRIRIFFYNVYAEVMEGVFRDFREESFEKEKVRSGKKKVDRSKVAKFLMSLGNVPAHCIMPLSIALEGVHPHLQQYILNPLGDDEFGALSPYCICIGDNCSMKLGSDKFAFDHEELEVRLVEEPDATSPMDAIGSAWDEAAVTSETVKAPGKGYYLEGEQSSMIHQYFKLTKGSTVEEMGAMTFNSGENEVPPTANDTGTAQQQAGQSSEVTIGNAAGGGKTNGANAGQSTARETQIIRPPFIVPLRDLLPLLMENNMNELEDRITVYGVALGFSPPTLTQYKDWKMSIVLIDDTLPLYNQAEGDTTSSSNPNRELHVPSVTLNLFAKDKAHLPAVRAAGDVVCCQKVQLQQWNNEPQLLCTKRKMSSVIVVRPRQGNGPGVEMGELASSNDWSVSCSCHGSNDEHHALHWQLINGLWRWGQRRLSSYPTMSSNCKHTITDLESNMDHPEVSVNGDFTAAVTAILPVPEHLRRDNTPRGYLRLWDGTGPPVTDA